MESSKSWEAIATLGSRIVAELSLESRGDTLCRWMAFRIAELMQQADRGGAAGESAKTACIELILKLWANRSQMGRGRPLGETIDAFERLIGDPRDRPPVRKGDQKSWLETLGQLRRLHEREGFAWQTAAFLGIDPAEARRWMESGHEHLSERERRIAEHVITLHDQLQDGRLYLEAQPLDKDDAAKRKEAIIEVLRKLGTERDDLLAQLGVKRGPIRANAKRGKGKTKRR